MGESPVEEKAELIRLLMLLRRQGIQSPELLSAIELVPRHWFVDEEHLAEAYADLPLPFGDGEFLVKPSVLGFILQTLEIEPRQCVLEVGTGTGYQTSILSRLARRVFTIERDGEMLREARRRLEELTCRNVISLFADGSKGWPIHAPFDRIIVNAACLEVPGALADQLASGGRLLLPRYVSSDEQQLVLVERNGSSFDETICLPVHFTPLREGLA